MIVEVRPRRQILDEPLLAPGSELVAGRGVLRRQQPGHHRPAVHAWRNGNPSEVQDGWRDVDVARQLRQGRAGRDAGPPHEERDTNVSLERVLLRCADSPLSLLVAL